MMRLAHISKKSIVWLPRRGVTEEVLPVKELVRDPGRDWQSAVAESKLLGLCKRAAEHER